MSGSNEIFASSAPGLGTRSPAGSPHPKDLRNYRVKSPQSNESSDNACSTLSADEIDEQIRAYFAQDLT